MFLESCCTDLESVLTAVKCGASRIELCENLEVGGVTPSESLILSVLDNSSIPVNVLVRPRGGDFVYNEQEVSVMLSSIAFCRENGVNAVVIGALDSDGNVDMPVMRRLIAAARPMEVTFHRAFDVCSDPYESLEDIISLGCDRLLTSGHEDDAYKGRFTIAELVKRSGGRIKILAGCGVRPGNIKEIESVSHAPEFHSSYLPFEL